MINFAVSDELAAINRRLGYRLATPARTRACGYPRFCCLQVARRAAGSAPRRTPASTDSDSARPTRLFRQATPERGLEAERDRLRDQAGARSPPPPARRGPGA